MVRMEKDVLLSPSLLSADFLQLDKELDAIKAKGAAMIHLDVMDGHFVPNLTFGVPLITAVRKATDLLLDTHLMVTNPSDYIKPLAEAGTDYCTFHIEAAVHVHRLITAIREAGMRPGVSFVPSTPVAHLTEVLPFIDVVLVMTVNPGFSGQTLIPACINKIQHLDRLRREHGFTYKISVDGGITQTNLPLVLASGADIVVSGSSFFSGELLL